MLTLTELSHGLTAKRIEGTGLSSTNIEAVNVMARRAADALLPTGSVGRSVHVYWVPGRIEVLGKHTDYAGGRSMLAVTEQGFLVVAAPREDATVRIFALDIDEVAEFELDPDLTPVMGDWRNYPMTVVRRLARNFPDIDRGADIAFASTIPIAAGMSSSSALMIGIYQILAVINDLAKKEQYQANIQSQEQLAEYLGTIENGQTYGTLAGDSGVGTFGGSEDHTAILCCQAGALSQYRYCPTQFEQRLVLPDGYLFAIAASGVIADKTGSARDLYNRASALAAEVTAVWNQATGHQDAHMAAMVERCEGDAQPISAVLEQADSSNFAPEELVRRFLHFFQENEEFIPAAAAALSSEDLAAFSDVVNRSQFEGVRLLGNQNDETIALASIALEHGALAASAFGAGFGGSVWALAAADRIDALIDSWRHDYLTRFPQHRSAARFFKSRPGPAAMAL